MNGAIIVYVLGWILICEGGLMVPALICGMIYGESCVNSFLVTIALCLVIGLLCVMHKPEDNRMYLREGYAITAITWIVISVMGAIPFVISGSIPDPVDALFETMSGFTTTGASIVPAVEDLQHGILFWRSFTHWVGGMGVLVFLLCLLPLAGGGKGSYMNLMKAESPGPQVEKLVPKVRSTASILYGIYFGLTALEFICLMLAGMPVFDSITTAVGTAGTGGFGIKNDSIAGYSPLIQWIVTIFMIAFGVNFNFYFYVLLRKVKKALAMEEVRAYIGIILVSIVMITLNIRSMFSTLGETIRHASFQVATVITTTGFATTDFDLWPTFSKCILVILMFIGACAGSTGGGMKVSRFIIEVKTIRKELIRLVHPQSIGVISVDEKPVAHEVLRSTNVYMVTYFFIFVISLLLVSLDEESIVTTFTAIAATLNNIGPGLEAVGPTANFAHFSVLSKLVMIFDMMVGRLELFPALVLLSPETWRKF